MHLLKAVSKRLNETPPHPFNMHLFTTTDDLSGFMYKVRCETVLLSSGVLFLNIRSKISVHLSHVLNTCLSFREVFLGTVIQS